RGQRVAEEGLPGQGHGPAGRRRAGGLGRTGGDGVVSVTVVVYAALAAFALVLASGPVVIPALRRLRVGQVIRQQGPARHLAKAGTPTMGGLMFVGACVLASVWFGPRTPTLWVSLGVILAYAAIGFADDFAKVARRRSLGLRARTKLAGQVVAGLLLYAVAARQGLGT